MARLTSRFVSPRDRAHLKQTQTLQSIRRSWLKRRILLKGLFLLARNPAPVLFAQAAIPAAGTITPQTMLAMTQHLKNAVRDPAQIKGTTVANLRTPAYWADRIKLSAQDASTAAQFVSVILVRMDQRLASLGLTGQPWTEQQRVMFLRRHMHGFFYTALINQLKDEKQQAELFIREVLPLLFEEQQMFARSMPAAGPADFVLSAEIAPILTIFQKSWPRMYTAASALRGELPGTYRPAARPLGRMIALQLLNHALQERDFVSLSIGTPLPDRRTAIGVSLFRRLPETAAIYQTGPLRTRVSDVMPIWNVGQVSQLSGADTGGFTVPEIQNEMYVIASEWSRMAALIVPIIQTTGDAMPAGYRFIFWDPVVRTIFQMMFGAVSAGTIETVLKYDVAVHEILHRWFRVVHQSQPVTDLFDVFLPDLTRAQAEYLYLEYAAVCGTMAFSSIPLWNVLHWVFMLPAKIDSMKSPTARMGEQLLRDFSRELQSEMGEASIALQAVKAPLPRHEGLRILRAWVEKSIPLAVVQAAARRIYTRRIGQLFPTVTRETPLRASMDSTSVLTSAGLLLTTRRSMLGFLSGPSVIVLAQSSQAPLSIPLSTVQAILQHMKTMVRDPAQLNAARIAVLKTSGYWKSRLTLNDTKAAQAEAFVRVMEGELTRRLEKAGFTRHPWTEAQRVRFLQRQIQGFLTVTLISLETNVERQVALFADQFLPLLFLEQNVFANSTPGADPSDFMLAQQIDDLAPFLQKNWPLMAIVLRLWRADLRSSYLPTTQTSSRLIFFELFTKALAQQNYVAELMASPRKDGRRPISIAMHRRLPRTTTFVTDSLSTRVTDTSLLWSVGAPILPMNGRQGGFTIPEVEEEVYVVPSTWQEIAGSVVAVLCSVGDSKPAEYALGFWHPVLRLTFQTIFGLASQDEIVGLLERDAALHEVGHRWFRAFLNRLRGALFSIFRQKGLTVENADYLYLEYAAMTATLAFSTIPLWSVVQWVIMMLPAKNSPLTGSLQAVLAEQLIRDFAEELKSELGDAAQTLVSIKAALTREDALPFLQAWIENKIPLPAVQSAARRLFTRHFGKLFETLVIEPALRAAA